MALIDQKYLVMYVKYLEIDCGAAGASWYIGALHRLSQTSSQSFSSFMASSSPSSGVSLNDLLSSFASRASSTALFQDRGWVEGRMPTEIARGPEMDRCPGECLVLMVLVVLVV